MREFLLLAKAAMTVVKFAAAAAIVKKAATPKTSQIPTPIPASNTSPIPPPKSSPIPAPKTSPIPPQKRTDILLDMVTSSKTENLGYRLIPNDNGSEYTAVISASNLRQDIVIPNAYNGLPVTEVKWEAVAEHENKIRLFIPDTVKKLRLNAILFSNGGKRHGRWIKLIIDERNPYLVTENRCVYSKDKTVLWCAQCKTNFVTLPDTVREIAPYAFAGNLHTFGVTLPPSVRVIGEGAFLHCENLRSVNAENVVSIGKRAFMNCAKIREFICEKLHDIGDGCFYGCYDMFKVKLPVTLAEVGEEVFRSVHYIDFFDNLKAPLRSFVYVAAFVSVRSAESGKVKYKFCVDRNSPPRIIELHRNGWGEYGEFDFEKHDRLFEDYCSHNPVSGPYYSVMPLFRLGYRYKLTEHAREYYVKWLKDYGDFQYSICGIETDIKDFSALYSERILSPSSLAFRMLISDARGDRAENAQMLDMLEEFCRDGIYSADDILEFIDLFSKCNKTEYTARLLEIRNTFFPYEDTLNLE